MPVAASVVAMVVALALAMVVVVSSVLAVIVVVGCVYAAVEAGIGVPSELLGPEGCCTLRLLVGSDGYVPAVSCSRSSGQV